MSRHEAGSLARLIRHCVLARMFALEQKAGP
jgi:hypothetical protein